MDNPPDLVGEHWVDEAEVMLVFGCDVFQPCVQLCGEDAEHRLYLPEVVLATKVSDEADSGLYIINPLSAMRKMQNRRCWKECEHRTASVRHYLRSLLTRRVL